MDVSKESVQTQPYRSVELRSNAFAVQPERRFTIATPRHIAARAVYRRWIVVGLLLLLLQVAAPFLCADGITFNDASGVFEPTGFTGAPANTSTVSFASSNLNFAVVTAGYFVTSFGSQAISPNFTQSSGPAIGAVIVPSGDPVLGSTIIPLGLPTAGPTIVPSGDPVLDSTIIPLGRPTAGPTIVPLGGATIDATVVPEPASLWLVGIGLAILAFCNHRKLTINRRV